MVETDTSLVDELSPSQAFEVLKNTPSSALVDVRTQAEWAFVGMPDLTPIDKDVMAVEWVSFPTMARNQRFMDQLIEQAGVLPERLFFICRSGARSLSAARLVAAEMEARGLGLHCTNVSEGFEGDLDGARHRGFQNGWKQHGLPWRQS